MKTCFVLHVNQDVFQMFLIVHTDRSVYKHSCIVWPEIVQFIIGVLILLKYFCFVNECWKMIVKYVIRHH